MPWITDYLQPRSFPFVMLWRVLSNVWLRNYVSWNNGLVLQQLIPFRHNTYVWFLPRAQLVSKHFKHTSILKILENLTIPSRPASKDKIERESDDHERPDCKIGKQHDTKCGLNLHETLFLLANFKMKQK